MADSDPAHFTVVGPFVAPIEGQARNTAAASAKSNPRSAKAASRFAGSKVIITELLYPQLIDSGAGRRVIMFL